LSASRLVLLVPGLRLTWFWSFRISSPSGLLGPMSLHGGPPWPAKMAWWFSSLICRIPDPTNLLYYEYIHKYVSDTYTKTWNLELGLKKWNKKRGNDVKINFFRSQTRRGSAIGNAMAVLRCSPHQLIDASLGLNTF